ARVIVGAHGAGLTNLMFAPPGAAVVEISNTTIYHMGDFKFISAQMGHRYAEVVSGWYPEDRSTALGQKSDYLVDAGQVMLALQDVAPEVFTQ
ncbi:MAG: glycosyltransferase family 61 protein, partial [Pseudomonadota bacterium]